MNTEARDELIYEESFGWQRETIVHQIKVIEYHGNRPFAVYTDHGGFDFEYCRRDDALTFEDTGGGVSGEHGIAPFCKPSPPPAKIWVADGIRLTRWESHEQPKVAIADDAELIAMGYIRLKRPLLLKTWNGKTRNPFEAAEESDCRLEYCSICDDRLPENETCDHIFYPDGGEPVGAGTNKPDQESVFAALDWLESVNGWRDWQIWRYRTPDAKNVLEAIEKNLLAAQVHRYHACSRGIEEAVYDSFDDTNADGEASELFEACEHGLGWLTTLGQDTPEANAITLRWIMEWRLSRGERAKARERKTLIRELMSFLTDLNRHVICAALGIEGKKKDELDGVPVERIREVVAQLKAAALA